MTDFQVGDVVTAEGASAILGDVVAVDDAEDLVTVRWRETTTVECAHDLSLEQRPAAREYLTVRYDVTGLSDDERGTLALEASAISEYRPVDNHDGTGGHPDVPVEIDFDVVAE